MRPDFSYQILEETRHRPWPMPDRPWIMTQTWHDLLFAHWRVDAALLRARVPAALDLDLRDGEAWLGIVPFHMTNVAPRGVPALPWVSAFPELNVRTYVRVRDKPGVYFFSLDAANALAVAAARIVFHLPYYTAEMTVSVMDGRIAYRSRRRSNPVAAFEADYAPQGPAAHPPPGSLEEFLTERYCLYTVNAAGAVWRLEIHHPPWPLQAADARLIANGMSDAAGLRLPPDRPLLHFAKRQDIVAWPMTTVRR